MLVRNLPYRGFSTRTAIVRTVCRLQAGDTAGCRLAWLHLLALLLLWLLAVSAMAQTNLPQLELPDLEIRLWHGEVQVRGAAGYKENVTLSSTDPQGSAFWSSGIEALAFRLPSGGWQFNAFLDAVDVRYFDSPSVDNEQQVMAVTELSRDLGHDWKSALGLNYLYQNQVFDFSTTYTNAAAIGQIVGHTLTPRWRLRKEMQPFWAETEISATRQILKSPLDSYWQLDPRLTLGRHLGARSEISLAYQFSWLGYDSREQTDALGLAMTNTSLTLQTHLVELAWTQAWDNKKRWQTTTRAGAEFNHDNGSGFYDYRNYRVVQELRFRDSHWEARLRARLSHYDYLSQPVSADDMSPRRRTVFAVTFQAERTLGKHLKAFGSYSWENSISNPSFDEYQASTVMGGLAVTF